MDLGSLTPLPGGWSGETFLAEAAGERTVVRVYARPGHRGAEGVVVDASLLRLVRGLVPVPRVLEARHATDQTPALLVTEYVAGTRAELVLPALSDADVGRLGGSLGDVAATLAGIAMLAPGWFVDGDLKVAPFGLAEGLPEWVAEHAPTLGLAGSALARLTEVAASAQDLLDTVPRTCLVHSDLNLKNILVDPDSLAVTAVVDWEFAHAGHPFTDLGNLLRFERRPAYADAVVSAYCERRGGEPERALELARAADLWALVDLAARRGDNPVALRAAELLGAIAQSGDLHAVPAGWTPAGPPA